MHPMPRSSTPAVVALALVSAILSVATAHAIHPEVGSEVFEIRLPEYGADLSPAHARADAVVEAAAVGLGGQWRVYRWDRAADTPAWIYGSGYPLALPGTDDAGLEAAARAFIAAHPEIFRARNEDLRLEAIERGAGKLGIHFAQTYEGLPVVGGRVRLVAGESGRLVAFGSEFHSAIDLEPVAALGADAALETAKRAVPFDPMVDEVIGTPELVVVPVERFEGGATYRLAWRVRVTTQEPLGIWLTHVDAETGEIFWRENEVEFLYEGTSKGDVEIPTYCAGVTPDTPFRNMRVVVDGVGPDTTDASGQFSVAGSAGPATVTAEFDGPEADVLNHMGPDAHFSGPIEENVPLDIVWTDANSHPAERDAFYYTNETHAYMKSIDPIWDYQKYTVNVNIDATCNAFWTPSSINFYREGGGCANTGRIGDVVAHEYGHGVQFSLLYSQGDQGLGEGNSDILGTLMIDESIIARGWTLNCTTGIRDCENTLRFPEDVIGHEIHDAGRVICGFNWDTWQELSASLGPEVGKAKVAELWHFSRKIFRPDIQPDQVFAYFVIDDDDETLLNGTPHYEEICAGATNHGFDCPETMPVYISHAPLEDTQNTQDPYPVVAEILAFEGVLDPDSLLCNYRVNLGSFAALQMTPTGNPDEFAASIPALPLGSLVEYYIQAANDVGGRLTHPVDAPGMRHAFFVGTLQVALSADMETDPGWTVGPSTARRGRWERGDPVGIVKYIGGQPVQLQPEDDHTPDPGTQCWITGNGAGFPGDNSVNNGGYTTLQSAVYDFSGEQYVRATFWLWYSNHLGTNTDDVFNIDVSTNGGSTWMTLGERSANTAEAWEKMRFDVTNFVPATSSTKFRFVARDLGEPSLVEAGVDDFMIEVLPAAQAVESPMASAPAEFAVAQNRPNPFNPTTEISYSVPSRTLLSLRIYDVDGRMLRTLVDGVAEPGDHTARWDGRDASGILVPSGVYYYRLAADDFEVTRAMALVK